MNQFQSAHRIAVTKWIFGLFVTANFLGAAFAQSVASNFPSKPVRIIVPQTPGGASDALARIVGQKLSEKLNVLFGLRIETTKGRLSRLY